MDENEDLIARMEDILEENDSLKQQLNSRNINQLDGSKYRSTPLSHSRQQRRHYWEDLDDRETSTQATIRNRSSGQRSVRSNGSQQYVIDHNEEDDDSSDSPHRGVTHTSLRKSLTAGGGTRKSSGNSSSSHTVAFENSDQVVNVPVTGSMRSARLRVATPFLSGEAVDKLVGGVTAPVVAIGGVSPAVTTSTIPQPTTTYSGGSGIDSSGTTSGERHGSVVNFEANVSVVEVAVNESDEPGHHIRSIRGRIATPFIHDTAQATGETSTNQ